MHTGPDEKQVAPDRRVANWTTPERPETRTNFKARYASRQRESIEPQPGWRSLFAFTTKKHSLLLCLALLLSMASGVVSPILAILLGRIFDSFTNFGGGTLGEADFRHELSMYSSYLAGLGLARWLLNGTFFMSWLTFGEVQARTCRSRIFDGLLEKPTEWYDTRKSGIGAIATRLQTQIRELQIGTSQPLGFVTQYIATVIAALAVAFYSCWNLTLVTLATVPVTAIVLSVISARMQVNIIGQQEQLSIASKSATNAFSAIETVKCFNGQQCEATKYASVIKEAAGYYLLQAKANALQIGFVRCMTLCLFVQGFWYGNYLVISGARTTGTVITTFWSCLTATQAIEEVLPHILVLEKGKAAAAALRAIVALIQSNRSMPEARGGQIPTICLGQVEFRNVSFAYPARPKQLTISNTSCLFAAGETTFVIGKSGSGKSTLAQLLMRFYAPTSGDIFLDNVALMDLDCHWIRRNITLVEQQSILFSGTVFQNIAMGMENLWTVSIDDVRQAAEFALLQQTIIDLPSGLDTIVGARGNDLSGGQRQRMALARARLRDSPVLILDESTSALDHISRALMMTAIRQWRRGKTTIIVSHDISQIESQDFVYVLGDGRVVQAGYRYALEQDLNSAFTKFLPAQKLLPQTSTNEEEDTRTTTSCVTPDSASDRSLDLIESLDAHLYKETKPARTFIPSVFADRGRETTSTFSFATPISPAVVSLWRSTLSSPNYNLNARMTQRHSIMSPLSSNPVERNPTKRASKRLSQNAIELLEMTGMTAVENRLTLINHKRRPISDPFKTPTSSHGPQDEIWTAVEENTGSLSEPPASSIRDVLRTIWPALDQRIRIYLVIGFASAALHAVATPMFSWIFSKLLATFFLPGGSRQALQWSLAILCIAVVDGVSCYVMHMILEYCGQSWVDSIRTEAVNRILHQSRQFFAEEKNSSALLAQVLDRNAEEMRNLLGRFAAFVFVAVVMMAMAIIWSLAVCWKLTLIGLSAIPVSYAITRGYQTVSAKMESKSNDAADVASSILNETFTNIKTVRALTLETHFCNMHIKATRQALQIGLSRALYCGFFFGISESMIFWVIALVFYYGAILASSGQFSVEDILVVFSMLLFSMANLTAMVSFIPQINSSKDTATRLIRLAQLPQTSHEHVGTARIRSVGNITINDLCFSYPSRPDENILRGLNLTFAAGTSTAIVGSSGSGKSTIASLLVRLYPTGPHPPGALPQICLTGRDINRIHIDTLRGLISVVQQTPILFPATVAENITYGLAKDSEYNNLDSIRAAAAAAGIDEFITSLPTGYATPIGDGGMGLSGGQAQRLAIARALVRSPTVLILDEATSALDVESAGLVRKSIQNLMMQNREIMIIIITHSRDMMEIADRIVVLDHGRVVEEGKFEELLEENGAFAKLLSGGQWMGQGRKRGKDKRDLGLKDPNWSGKKRGPNLPSQF